MLYKSEVESEVESKVEAKVESKAESRVPGGPGAGGPTPKIFRKICEGPQIFFRVRHYRTGATIEQVRRSKTIFHEPPYEQNFMRKVLDKSLIPNSGRSDARTSGRSDVRTPGRPDARTFGRLPSPHFQFLPSSRRGPKAGPRRHEPGGAGPRRDERKNCEKQTKNERVRQRKVF